MLYPQPSIHSHRSLGALRFAVRSAWGRLARMPSTQQEPLPHTPLVSETASAKVTPVSNYSMYLCVSLHVDFQTCHSINPYSPPMRTHIGYIFRNNFQTQTRNLSTMGTVFPCARGHASNPINAIITATSQSIMFQYCMKSVKQRCDAFRICV